MSVQSRHRCSVFTFITFFQSVYLLFLFFFNDTATTEIYTLSLHDALPISDIATSCTGRSAGTNEVLSPGAASRSPDRKSTRLNSSHLVISYAVFCLKKKKLKLTGYPISLSQTTYEDAILHLMTHDNKAVAD